MNFEKQQNVDNNLLEEQYLALKEQENIHPKNNLQTPNQRKLEDISQVRTWVLNKLFEIFEVLNVPAHVQQSTIAYFDYYIQVSEINKNEIYYISIACLLLALKTEKQDISMEVHHLDNMNIMREDLYKLEIKVLKSLGWKLDFVSPQEFTDLFLIILPFLSQINTEKTKNLNLVSMAHNNFMRFKSSSIALGVLLYQTDSELSDDEFALLEKIISEMIDLNFQEIEDVYNYLHCYVQQCLQQQKQQQLEQNNNSNNYNNNIVQEKQFVFDEQEYDNFNIQFNEQIKIDYEKQEDYYDNIKQQLSTEGSDGLDETQFFSNNNIKKQQNHNNNNVEDLEYLCVEELQF